MRLSDHRLRHSHASATRVRGGGFVLAVAVALVGDAARADPPPAAEPPVLPAPAAPTPDAPEAASAPAAPSAAAPAAPPDETSVARALFVEGLGLADQQHWEQAVDCFRRVLVIRWSAAAAHNLGSALVELGRLVEAGEQLRLVARDAEADAAMRAASQRMLDAIEPQIGKLTLHVLGERAALDVMLDGHVLPAAALDGVIRIDPGRHVIVARRAGTYVARQDIFLGSGAPRAMSITLDTTPAPPEFEPAPASLAVQTVPDSSPSPAAPAATAVPPTAVPPTGEAPFPAPVPAQRDEAGSEWWLWLGGGVAATGIVALAIALGFANETAAPHPIEGDLSPRVLRGRVGAP